MDSFDRTRWLYSCLLFHRTIESLLNRLAADERGIIGLRLDGKSYRDIAKAMKRSDKKWTETRVRHACERIERRLCDSLLGPQSAVMQIGVQRVESA